MTQKKQVLCDLQVLFSIYNCQTPEHEKSPEIKNPNFSFMEGMEELEKETLLETIRFHREDNSIWNTAEAGK